LELKLGNMFDHESTVEAVDIIVCQTRVPTRCHSKLLKLLQCMKKGARLLAYENITGFLNGPEFFARLEINDYNDRFLTSWAQTRGHRFHLFERK